MILWILLFVILAVVFYFYLRYRKKWASARKEISDGSTKVYFKANRPINKLTLYTYFEKEKHTFVRKNISSGEEIIFEYPISNSSVKLVAETENEKKEIELI